MSFKLDNFQLLTPGLYSGDDVDIRINYMIECTQPWRVLWRAKIEVVLDGQRGYILDDLSFGHGGKDNALISVSGKMPSGKDLRGKVIFGAEFWGGFPPMPPPTFPKFAERDIVIPNLDDVTPSPPPDGVPPAVCTEGQERCEGFDLYVCQNNQWKVKEYNSPECGYTPEPICTNGDERCVGTELQVCVGDHWEIRERNSPRCGYIPPDGGEPTPPTKDGEGIGGWFDRNKTAIIIGSAVALAIALVILFTRKLKFQKPITGIKSPIARR